MGADVGRRFSLIKQNEGRLHQGRGLGERWAILR